MIEIWIDQDGMAPVDVKIPCLALNSHSELKWKPETVLELRGTVNFAFVVCKSYN
jgi:hypothetical protein